jgi:hypothetical protein
MTDVIWRLKEWIVLGKYLKFRFHKVKWTEVNLQI